MSYFRLGVAMWDPGIVWELRSDNALLESVAGSSASGSHNLTVDARSVDSHLFCNGGSCSRQGASLVRISDLSVTVEDDQPPTASVGPSLPSGTPVWGTVQVPYRASDEGGGLRGAQLLLDGADVADAPDSNGGRCVQPFEFMAPCKAAIESSISLDTTRLPEGSHEIAISVFDAANQSGLSAPVSVEVHNAPLMLEAPRLNGKAQLGATLTATSGKWGGLPSTYAYQWLRCPATAGSGEGAGCAPIPGATGASYVPGAGDRGQRLAVKVAATNGVGSASALSAVSDVVSGDASAPVLSGVSLSRTRFRVGKSQTALAATAKGARGTILRFASSEAGKLSIAISRARKRGAKPLATLTRAISAGPGHVPFSGRIGKRPLRPGRYTLTLTATDAAGEVSKATRLSFTILPG